MKHLFYKYWWAILSCWACTNSSAAQTSFSISDTLKQWQMPVNEGLSYTITNLTNMTSQYLDMVYEAHHDSPFPSLWTTEYTKPADNRYRPIDTSTFVLVNDNSQTTTFYCLFLPNGQTGTGTTRVKFYPQNNPADSVWVRFTVTFYQPVATTNINSNAEELVVYPNPISDFIQIQCPNFTNKIIIYDAIGQLVQTYFITNNNILTLDINHWTTGTYYINSIDKNNKIISTKPFIKL